MAKHELLHEIFLSSVAAASASLGFLQATLEPHMREFNLSPLLVGSMFVINGACYGISAPLWGYVCDRRPAKLVMVCGAVCILVNFSIIGPLPFFPFKKSLGLIIGALVLQGKQVEEDHCPKEIGSCPPFQASVLARRSSPGLPRRIGRPLRPGSPTTLTRTASSRVREDSNAC